MDENKKARAVELTDEEMNGVAGGKAALSIKYEGNIIGFIDCDVNDMTSMDFENNMFVSNTCSNFDRISTSQGKCCANCTHYTRYDIVNSDYRTMIDYYATHGYDYGSHQI